jgi:hypothetical protein
MNAGNTKDHLDIARRECIDQSFAYGCHCCTSVLFF